MMVKLASFYNKINLFRDDYCNNADSVFTIETAWRGLLCLRQVESRSELERAAVGAKAIESPLCNTQRCS